MQTTRFIEEMQLALLSPEEDPKHSLDDQTAQDLSLRVVLTLSLMKKRQLTTTRVKTALPQEQPTYHLRELGLRKSLVHDQIFVGNQLCVMHHENHMLIGGAKPQQECFINKLSAYMLLEDTKQLDEQTPLIFLGRSLEYNRAGKSISLTLPSAFYLELLGRYGLEDATATSSPRDELESAAPRWNIILDATRTKLYKQTVGDLIWSSCSRPDIGFAVQQLSNSFKQPTEHAEKQLVSVLRCLKGTQHYGISLQPPRRWERAQNLELLAFSATSWAASTRQATTRAADVDSVRLACAIAFHTKNLLQDLELVHPMSFRLLTGGPLAMQLGLSKKERHIDLWHWFGQFQLSKVPPHQNLAESLTYNLSASGLHRLLPQLKMHTRPAEMLALPTELAGEVAFFRSSSSNFFIGMLRKAPAMAQLGSEQLLGKELGKPINIPELESALLSETSLQSDELVAAYSTDSFQHQSLQLDELVAACSKDSFQHQSLQPDELMATYFRDSFQHQSLHADELAAAYSTESFQPQRLQQKELVRLKAFKPASSTRVSQDQLDAWKSTRTSHSLNPTSLLSIFILMVRIFLSNSFPFSFLSNNFTDCWGLELAEQDEFSTNFWAKNFEKDELRTCWEKGIEKHNELPNLLWDHELEELLTNKPFQLDQIQEYNQYKQQHDQLEENND